MEENKESREKRLVKNCEEAMVDAVDSLWAANGKFVWISQKQIYCPQFVCPSDLEDIRSSSRKMNARFEALYESQKEIRKFNETNKQKKFENVLLRCEKVLDKIRTLVRLMARLETEIELIFEKNKVKSDKASKDSKKAESNA